MPLYSFCCDRCGIFTALRSMAAFAEPAACPACGAEANRTVASPYLMRLNPAIRRAHERNEKSAHEPRVVRHEDWVREGRLRQTDSYLHSHGHHHAHGH
ncbi:zinc ribbon domain-containing protein [Aquabacter sp. CN5-332]|uniref:FmdB family zinc ribbon protein n=1 Tax=Aquabacter sp. CN5-332 TaxID=3156608 RepID=UPI0032B5286A